MQTSSQYYNKLHLFSRLVGAIVAVIGGAVLLGWALDSVFLTSILPGFTRMKPATAVSLICAGLSLALLAADKPGRRAVWLQRLAAGAAALMGFVSLSQKLFAWALPLDAVLASVPGWATRILAAGRMSPPSAAILILVGAALLMLRTRRGHAAAQALALLVLVFGLLGVLGILYGANPVYQIAALPPTSALSALAFCLLAGGLLSLDAGRGLTAIVVSSGPGGQMARLLLPAAILIPGLLGLLRLGILRAGLYDLPEAVALTVIANVLVFSLLVVLSAHALDRTAHARRTSDERFRFLFENMLNGFAYCKMLFDEGRPQDFIYLDVNSAFETLTGLKNVVGKRVSEVIPGIRESDAMLFEIYGRVALTGIPETFETYVEALTMWFSISVYSPEREYFVAVFDVITERKQADQKLKESEERYRSTLDGMLEGCQIIGFDTRYLYLNDAAAQHGRRAKEELLGKTMTEMYPGIENTEMFGLLRRCLDERIPARMVNEFVYPDQTTGWFDLSIQPVREGAFILSVDITERRQAEEKLRESEQLFRAVFEHSTLAKSLTAPDGRLLMVNQAFSELVGYSIDELQQGDFARITHPEDVAKSQEVMRRALANERNGSRIEKRYIHKSGAVIWGDMSTILVRDPDGKPRYFITAVMDITERKRAEMEIRTLNAELEQRVVERTAQLQQSEEKFFKAFWASPAAISIASQADGRWIEVNEALAKMTGYDRKELVGHTSAEMGLVDPAAREKILQSIRERGAVRDVEIQLHNRLGQALDVLVSTEPIEINDQPCVLTIQYDITERKRAEAEVQRLNTDLEKRQAALEAANKELEAFSYSVSHDLRAPLRAVDGFSRILLEDYAADLPAEAQRYLRLVRGGAQQMGRLIEDLLAFSRLGRQPLRRQRVEPAELVRQVLQELEDERQGRQVNISIADLPPCQGDPALLKQVFANLLANALKFTRRQPEARIEVGSRQEGGQTVYFVSDNGAGFDMQYADKLFGVFQRLHRAEDYEGTGVGLAIVQRIIHRHGGRIWARAELGKGAAFYFTLGGERPTDG